MLSRILIALAFLAADPRCGVSAPRPNILWLTSEDHGPHLGCYGDAYASTPNIDALAARSLLYLRCWSNAPVCAPARTTLISGMYAPSTGSEHMRSHVPYPAGKHMFPQFLREAGYYCTNNVKEDYNLAKPGDVWDDSSNKAHWRNRQPGQPFFAVFNSTKSHESQIRARPHTPVHDPNNVRVPPYHPDTPEVRQDWAQYYDKVAEADADAGQILQQLRDDGLAEDTIVFYFSDHGSGMPRNKRWPYHCGLHVPLVIHIPDQLRHLRPDDYAPGGTSNRLVSFVDFAPTVLSLAGIKPPDWMQGRAFLGEFPTPPQPLLYGFRGRMDERFDLVRSVTDGRYVYVRNYMPHKIYGQHLAYMFQTPTTRVWKELHDAGRLTPEQDAFWKPKPPEELYDLQSDPDEIRNLADHEEFRSIKEKLRTAQRQFAARIVDLGFLPEGEMHRLSEGTSPYDMARQKNRYPFERVRDIAELASYLEPDARPALTAALHDDVPAVRYWGALGLLMRGGDAVRAAQAELTAAMRDDHPDVRIAAAECLARFGGDADVAAALNVLVAHGSLERNDVFTSMAALNALSGLGRKFDSVAEIVRRLPTEGAVPHPRYAPYVERLLSDLAAGW